eukprot:190311-Pyramimonas_sp.AAC.1
MVMTWKKIHEGWKLLTRAYMGPSHKKDSWMGPKGPGSLGLSRDTSRRRLSPAGHLQAHRLRGVSWAHRRRVFSRARLRVTTFN